MERTQLIKVGGALAVGGAMFFLAQNLNQPPPVAAPVAAAPAPVVQEVEHEFVLVATMNATRGQRISPEMLDWQQWPAEAVAPSFIVQESRPQAIDELLDSVIRLDLFAGEPINEAKLVRAGDSGLMAALLAPGMRAVTTRVSVESAAGGFIMPGDRVDIILTAQLPRDPNLDNGQNITRYASGTIFENVKVLAINERYATSADSPASNAAVSYATFELSQEDAEALEEAAVTGTISLTLRGLQPNGPGRSTTRVDRNGNSGSSSLVVYRDGQQTQTAIRGY